MSASQIQASNDAFLPRSSDGKVDWNTLGNTLMASLLREVLEASYLDLKHNVQNKEEGIATDWHFQYEKHDLSVFTKATKDPSKCCFMSRGVIDAPVSEVAALLDSQHGLFINNKEILSARYIRDIVKTKTKKDLIGYIQLNVANWFLQGNRDLCYFCRKIYMDNGKYLSTIISIDCPECPVLPGLTRMKIFEGSGWVLEPYNGNPAATLASYVMHADCAQLPSFLINKGVKSHVLQVHKLRTLIWKQRKQQRTGHTQSNEDIPFALVPCAATPYEDALPMSAFTNYEYC